MMNVGITKSRHTEATAPSASLTTRRLAVSLSSLAPTLGMAPGNPRFVENKKSVRFVENNASAIHARVDLRTLNKRPDLSKNKTTRSKPDKSDKTCLFFYQQIIS